MQSLPSVSDTVGSKKSNNKMGKPINPHTFKGTAHHTTDAHVTGGLPTKRQGCSQRVWNKLLLQNIFNLKEVVPEVPRHGHPGEQRGSTLVSPVIPRLPIPIRRKRL